MRAQKMQLCVTSLLCVTVLHLLHGTLQPGCRRPVIDPIVEEMLSGPHLPTKIGWRELSWL